MMKLAIRLFKAGIMTAALVSVVSNIGLSAEESGKEFPVTKIPNLGSAAEWYFGPDGKHIIGNAKREGDENYQTYVAAVDGSRFTRINNTGEDACSYFFPSGDRILWTSTKDNLNLHKGNYSDPLDYPQGAELYSSDPDGTNIKRLTHNKVYEAEASVSPNGKWILFGRQIKGKMDLWRMRPDGSGQFQITRMEGWEPGGSFYFPDNETILFRAWKTEDQIKNAGKRGGLAMTLFTIKHDGTGLRQLTNDSGTNWAPYPAPDGRHYVFVKVLPPHNYEIFLGDLESDKQVQLTFNDSFDGFPSLSPDGKWLLFTSGRDSAPGKRELTQYLMDVSSLKLGPRR